MKIILASIGSVGDIRPLIAIGKRLREDGDTIIHGIQEEPWSLGISERKLGENWDSDEWNYFEKQVDRALSETEE